MHKYSAESCVAESFDTCYAEVQPEIYVLACVLKRIVPGRLGQWAESSLTVLYFWFFLGGGAKICVHSG